MCRVLKRFSIPRHEATKMWVNILYFKRLHVIHPMLAYVDKISRLPSVGAPFALLQIVLTIALSVSLRGRVFHHFRINSPLVRGVVVSAPLGAIGTTICFPRANGVTAVGLCVSTFPTGFAWQVATHVKKSMVVPTNFVSHCVSRFPTRMRIVFFPSWHPDCSWHGYFDSDRRNWNKNLVLMQRAKNATFFKYQAKAT